MEIPTPYAIVCSDLLGRHMLANKDLKLGEIIFEEYPIASGLIVQDAEENYNRVCIECYEETDEKCAGCEYARCESHDQLLPNQHTSLECDLLAKCQDVMKKMCRSHDDLAHQLCPLISSQLFYLRCLQLPPEGANKFKALETKYEEWSMSRLYNQFQQQIHLLRFIFGKVYEFPSELELCMVKARQDINSYEIQRPNCGIQAVYELGSMLEHNCIPNTYRSTRGRDLKLTIRAAQNITKGSHLSLSYTDLLWTTEQRQQELQDTKFFRCICSRCTDPSECGSLLSALRCPICSSSDEGVENPIIPFLNRVVINNSDQYKCTNCGTVKLHEEVRQTIKKAKHDLEYVENMFDVHPDADANENFMDWLRRWTDLGFMNKCLPAVFLHGQEQDFRALKLHSQNTLVLDVCHTLFLLILLANENITNDDLVLKITLGEHLLKSVAVLTAGISKFRCTILHDLSRAKIMLATRDSTNKEFQDNIKVALESWKDALNCLQYEEPDTAEGSLYQIGMEEYEKFRPLLSE